MARLYAKTFMGFMPLRLGVFVMSLTSIIGGTFVAVPAWLQIASIRAHPPGQVDRIALFLHIGLFTTITSIAFFGMIGSTFQARRLMIGYWIVLASLIIATIGIGIVVLFAVFQPNTPAEIVRCLHGATDSSTRLFCQNGIAVVKPLVVVIYVVAGIVLLAAWQTAYSYTVQLNRMALEEPKAAASGATGVKGLNISKPIPVSDDINPFQPPPPERYKGNAFSRLSSVFTGGRRQGRNTQRESALTPPRPVRRQDPSIGRGEGETTLSVAERYKRYSPPERWR